MAARFRLPGLRTIAVIGASFIAAACGTGGAVDELDGPEMSIVEMFRIGSIDGPEALTGVDQLIVTGADDILVSQRAENRILLFSSNGDRLAEIGRRGSGPGEFQHLTRMGVISDTLWVFDIRAVRFTYFDVTGELIRTTPVPFEFSMSGDAAFWPSGLLPDRSLYGGAPVPVDRIADGTVTSSALVRLSDSGEAIDTVAVMPLTNTQWVVRDPERPEMAAHYDRQPFSDADLVELSTWHPEVIRVERRADGPSGRLRITRMSLQGDTVYSREFRHRPREITPAQIDSVLSEVVERAAEGRLRELGTAGQLRRWAEESLYSPRYHVAVTAILPSRDGAVWLKRSTSGSGPSEWIVLDGAGEVRGVVRFPGGFELLAAAEDRAWGVYRDDLDVPYVVGYRVLVDG